MVIPTESALIFTDESGVKLPEIDIKKGTIGRGSNIRNSNEIKSLLLKEGFRIPTDDTELEKKYRIILKEFIRPARLIFSGTFREVCLFSDKLQKIVPTDLFIISGRYGLLHENNEIIPYHTKLGTVKDLEELDRRTSFSEVMLQEAKKRRFIIILLPSQILEYLIQNNWFKQLRDEQGIILVAGSSLKSDILKDVNAKFLIKRGVARIGKENQNTILEIVKSKPQQLEVTSFE